METLINIVNKNARKERHKKLFASRKVLRKYQADNSDRVEEISDIDNNDNSHVKHEEIGKFFWKITTAVFAAFLLYSALPTYAGSPDDEILNNAPVEFKLDKLATTNAGFILNTTGQSQSGERSGMSDTIVYTVQGGDTLSSIAQKFHLDISTISWANNIVNANQLKVGTELTILPVNGVLHEVKEGETVTKIATKYEAKKEDILAQNNLDEKSLKAGEFVIVPGGRIAVARDYIAYNRATTERSSGGDISQILQSGAAKTANGIIKLIKPAAGQYTQYYRRGHYAVDIANSSKGPIYAAASGKVVKAVYGWNGGYGNVIIVDHADGVKTLYAHNEALYVNVGDLVSKGQTIAWMGNSGRVYGRTGIHLHFEVIVNGVKKNPLAYF